MGGKITTTDSVFAVVRTSGVFKNSNYEIRISGAQCGNSECAEYTSSPMYGPENTRELGVTHDLKSLSGIYGQERM